jgi:predicted MFS family arabinose efflux permease
MVSGRTDFASPSIGRMNGRALVAAWLGWAFDGLDGYLYIAVASRLIKQLLNSEWGRAPTQAEVISHSAWVQAAFLVGWAIGGAIFGRLGDRFGRARTLTLTILTYAIFTGLSFFAQTWWQLLALRFIAALGIGGEWAAGSALVCETLPSRHRAWASAVLQSGYIVGCIAASFTAKAMSHLDPRWVFVVGVAPALVTLWIRRAVPEPESWANQAREHKPPPVSALFSRGLVRTTLVTTALTSIALTTAWALLFFAPQAVQQMGASLGWDAPRSQSLAADLAVFYFILNIVANFVATYAARALGYRWAFAIFFACALAAGLFGFSRGFTPMNIWWIYGSVMFFALGVFGLFPLYVPPLFPTLVRTLGAGVTYNAGRLISAVGTLCAGWIATKAQGAQGAMWWVTLLFVPALLLSPWIARPITSDGHRADEKDGGGKPASDA